jgi:hypothetical protein
MRSGCFYSYGVATQNFNLSLNYSMQGEKLVKIIDEAPYEPGAAACCAVPDPHALPAAARAYAVRFLLSYLSLFDAYVMLTRLDL